MVDVRPLFFANALFLMLLITAGFAHISNSDLPSGASLPTTDTAQTTQQKPIKQGTDAPGNTSQHNAKNPDSKATSKNPTKADHAIEADLKDEDIFADTPTTKQTDSLMAVSPENPGSEHSHNPTASNHERAKAHVKVSAPTEVVNAPKPATKPKPVAQVKPTAPPKPVQKPKPVVTTGKLIVRSNVSGDTVLINGKPYGPTKMEVDLPPGSYNVEVAKNGYTSWKTSVAVTRGKKQTLKARLEHYTTVDYRNGEWVNGVTTGEGTYVADDGTNYQGGFVNGKFHGVGSIRYPDGTDYRGEWFEGTMQGEGSLRTSEGDTYIGSFKDGEFNGEGTLTKANSDIYSGYWVSGSLNGLGSLTTKDGLLFVGGFSDNQFHGEGSLTYPDGRHYEGTFSKGQFHGKGIEIYSNGKKYVGQFMEGNYHGKGELMNPNGSKITGTFKFGQPFGKATLTTPEGEIFTARTTEPGVCYRLKSYRATQCPPMEGW